MTNPQPGMLEEPPQPNCSCYPSRSAPNCN